MWNNERSKLNGKRCRGIDLFTERDAGNHIRILTGKKEYSVDFWTRLRDKCDEALEYMEE